MSELYHYFIQQFRVESELPLPGDSQSRPSVLEEAPELLQVRNGAVPVAELDRPLARYFDGALCWYRQGDGFQLQVRDWLRLHVHDSGRLILVDASPERQAEAAAYVIGMGMGLCSAVLGYLSLHAAAVDLDGRRIGILAPSGAGKSTTLWALLQAGGYFANDDAVPVRIARGQAISFPCVSLYPKVSRELMARYGVECAEFVEVYAGRDKLWYPVPQARRALGLAPLDALFALWPLPGSESKPAQWDRKSAAQAIPILMRNSMAVLGSRPPFDTRTVMAHFAAVAEAVPLYTLEYPKRFDVLPELVEMIRSCAVRPLPQTRAVGAAVPCA